MKLAIIGSGYVGLVTAVCFAKRGHNVICVDIDKQKIDSINHGEPGIFESNLKEYLKDSLNRGLIKATTDLDYAIENSELCFICVPTPSKPDGSIDLAYIKNVSEAVGKRIPKRHYVVVIKSTVVPGTTDAIVIPLIEKASGKKIGSDFGVCMNPEFLREGSAIYDCENPDRIVIGESDKLSGDLLQKLYSNHTCQIIRTNNKIAELTKYTSNAFLATKITFANEIGNICKKLDVDVYEVMKIVSLDKRISPHFLNAGIGFGGSCFPKDVAAIVAKSKEIGHEAKMLSQVLYSNKEQRLKIVELLEKRLNDVKGKKISVLGLSFKPGTDDIRDAPSIDIIKFLKERGAKVVAYDPKASENMKKIHGDIEYKKSSQDALKGSDACLILTEWDEFKGLKDKDFNLMSKRVIIEGRKILNPENVKDFEGICW